MPLNFCTPFTPLLCPFTQNSYLLFIHNLDLSLRNLKNKLEIMDFYIPLEPNKCFSAVSEYTHTDRYIDANDTMQAFHTFSYHLPYPKSCADLSSIYIIFGVKIWVNSCIGSPSFPSWPAYLFFAYLYLDKDHSTQNQDSDHIIRLIHKCSSILLGLLI